MKRGISEATRRKLVEAIAVQYQRATRSEEGRILDEYVKLTRYHRKHAIRVLNQDRPVEAKSIRPSRRIYDEAVRQALIAICEAADRICGKRLRVVMQDYIRSLEGHGHLKLNPELREK